jgi:hypothetical protein
LEVGEENSIKGALLDACLCESLGGEEKIFKKNGRWVGNTVFN